MTNTTELRARVSESGLKYQFIAKQLSITPYALKKKIDNVNEFKANEILQLCDLLNIKTLMEREHIFFAK